MRTFVILGAIIMVIASLLMYGKFILLKVRRQGNIVKAPLIAKGSYTTKGGSYCYFRYNSDTFSSKLGQSTYANARLNDTFSFYHLDAEPGTFVNATYRIELLYFDVIFSIAIFIFGLSIIVFREKLLASIMTSNSSSYKKKSNKHSFHR